MTLVRKFRGAGAGFDRAAFTIDFDARQATCPQGRTSSSWNPVAQRGTDTIVITFAKVITIVSVPRWATGFQELLVRPCGQVACRASKSMVNAARSNPAPAPRNFRTRVIHPRPAPFSGGHPDRVRAGRGRWRTVVDARQHCWKAR